MRPLPWAAGRPERPKRKRSKYGALTCLQPSGRPRSAIDGATPLRGVARNFTIRRDEGSLLSWTKQYQFMRACYGISVSAVIGVVVSLLTRPEPFERQRGLVWGTIADALRRFKGSPGTEAEKRTASALPIAGADDAISRDGAELPLARISRKLADKLGAEAGDVLYVTDTRWWLGGLRSTHAVVGQVAEDSDGQSSIELGPTAFASVVTPRRKDTPVRVERLY